MKITQLHLKNFQQFKDLKLDFTHPETGKPLDRVCFIGQNGTGKTTILDLIYKSLKGLITDEKFVVQFLNPQNFSQITKQDISFSVELTNSQEEKLNLYHDEIGINVVSNDDEFKGIVNQDVFIDHPSMKYFEHDENMFTKRLRQIVSEVKSQSNLVAYLNTERQTFNQDIPSSSLNNALNLFNGFNDVHEISGETVDNFWTLLIYHIRKRENDRIEFENDPDNIEKTKKKLIEEFDTKHPEILIQIAQIWDKILHRAGLYFDTKNIRIPFQGNENLVAYIKSKSTGESIPYNRLSTGIKNFIFQIGHLFALHFNRKIDNDFLLIDEPSNSLYPDFVYELIGMYESVVFPHTQLFVATHNPIVAAQFHPYERFILEFDKEDFIRVRKGVSPIGDDPVDILEDDFLVQNIMPKEGMKEWQRFINLKREIHYLNKQKPFKNGEQEKLNNLLEEMSTIGRKYNF